MRRGEVWWTQLPRPTGRRPVLLLSRNSAYRVRTAVTVAPVTRTVRSIPTEVLVGRADGLPARSVINLDDIATIPKTLLKERLTSLSPSRMQDVDAAIRFALDLTSA